VFPSCAFKFAAEEICCHEEERVRKEEEEEEKEREGIHLLQHLFSEYRPTKFFVEELDEK